jgi:hypothetical protein
METGRVLDRLQTILRLRDELEVIVSVEDRPQRGARERVVVCDEHPQAHAPLCSRGKRGIGDRVGSDERDGGRGPNDGGIAPAGLRDARARGLAHAGRAAVGRDPH